ncbi:hypothetical protein ABFT80_14230 [Mesorhizobium sp. SB112]|uniref:hypothetical protein n=1 Tax=Mesorhizobium sp. SB112 TaxID=3151853 RepID=UPI003266CE87
MPDHTNKEGVLHVKANGSEKAVNINGTDMYRPLSISGSEMPRVVGRSSMVL